MMQRGKHAGESGATLILVLIISAVVGAVMTVVLSQTETSVRATDNLRDQAADAYSADGATNAMLNLLTTSGISCNTTTSAGIALGTATNPFYPDPNGMSGQALNAYASCNADGVNGATTSTVTPPAVTSTTTVTPPPVTSTTTSTPPVVVTTSGTALGAGDGTTPAYALFTTGTGSTDFGINITLDAANKEICIEDGSIYTGKDIQVGSETLHLQMDTAHGGNSSCTGANTWTDNSTTPPATYALAIQSADQATNGCLATTGGYTPTSCTNKAPSQATPNEDLTQASMTTIPLPVIKTVSPKLLCPKSSSPNKSTWAALTPGYYDNSWLAKLNNLSGSSACNVPVNSLWLSPGAYYFDLGGVWNWPGTLVAGTPIKNGRAAITGFDLTTIKDNASLANLNVIGSLPNACLDPDVDAAKADGTTGATLIFAGATSVSVGANSSEICANGATGNTPPVAIWGLGYPDEGNVHAVTVPIQSGGSQSVPTETLCRPDCGGASGTTLFATDSNGQANYFVRGFFYAPNAQLIMNLKNSAGQVFYWGVVARNLAIGVTGSSPSQPFAKLPKPANGIAPTVSTSTPPPVTSTATSYPPTTTTTNTVQPPPVTATAYVIRYVYVWTCTVSELTGSPPACPHTGNPDVRVRVAWTPGSGTPLKVLSWNNLR